MTRTLRVVALSMVIALLAVFLMAFTVSAQSVSSNYVAAGLGCKTVPTSDIVTSQKSHLANYKPNKLSVKVSTKLSLCIKNKTTSTQNVTYQGSILAKIPAGQTAGILCNRPNKSTFSLSSNPKAALHLVCTA